jgi:hypothetical protein
MAFVIGIGDLLSGRFWSVLNEQAAVNTMNFACTAKTGAGGTDQDLVNFLDFSYTLFFRALYPSTVEYRGCQVYFLKRLGTMTAAAPVVSITGAGVGTATGSPMPRNACAILKYSTGLRGPANRGRLYLPFIATEYQDTNGEPTAAFDILLNSFASGAVIPITVGSGGNTSTLVWSLLHKVKGSVPVDRGPITTAQAAGKYGQLHRRGDYGRANKSPI